MNDDTHREILREVERDIALQIEKVRQLQAVAAYHAAKLGVSAPLGESLPQASTNGHSRPNPSGQSGVKPTNRFKGVNQRMAAYTILAEAKRPLRAVDIARTMVEYGYPLTQEIGKLSNALFTTMTRDEKRFKKVGPGLWATVPIAKEESED